MIPPISLVLIYSKVKYIYGTFIYNPLLYVYIYIYIYIYTHTYIYFIKKKKKERERQNEKKGQEVIYNEMVVILPQMTEDTTKKKYSREYEMGMKRKKNSK